MAIGSAKVSGIYITETATFATAAPVGGDTWTHVPAIDQPLPALEQMLDTVVEGNAYGAGTAPVPTVKKSSIQLQTRVWTGSKGFGTGTDPTTCFMQKPLESYFGMAADTAFAGTTLAALSGPGLSSPIKVTSATGITAGKFVRNGTTKEVAMVTAVSGTDVTLSRDFTTYSAGVVLEGAFDFRPTLGQYAKALWMNAERDTHSRLLGAGAVFTLGLQNIAAGNALRYAFGFEFNSFAAGVTISSKTQNTYVSQPLIAKGAELIVDGTEEVCIYDGSIEFGVAKEWVECSGGTESRDGWIITDVEGSSLSFSEYYDADRWTAYEGQTGSNVMLVHSASTGFGAVAVYIPYATFTVQEAVNGKKESQTVTVKANMPTQSQVTAGFTSPIYYGVFSGE